MDQMKQLRRGLIARFLLVSLTVSVLIGALAAYSERERVFQVATDRILNRADVLRALLLDRLDREDFGDRDALGASLRVAAYTHDGANLDTGSYVLGRLLDGAGREVERLVDDRYPGIAGIVAYVDALPVPLPVAAERPQFTAIPIAGQDHIRALVPLPDSRGKVAAYVEGYFATTPERRKTALYRVLRAVGLAVGTVLLTTALLYPVIRGLMRRLGALSIDLLNANLETLQVLGGAIAKRDSDTDAHNYRVTLYSVRIAEAMGLDDVAIRTLIKGALLHDVGKIGISDNILLKPGRLDEREFAEMRNHVRHGLDIVGRSAWLRDACLVVGGHHEKYDGTGYTQGLAGGRIPLVARIFTVADVFDALTSRRPYKEPFDLATALRLLEEGRGGHFDPAVLDVFTGIAADLYARYANRDDSKLRGEHAVILDRYYRADLTALMG